MLTTFLLGRTFLFVQINEYVHIGFAPHDIAQASVFYGLTGLHGAHVFIGLTLLAMVTVRSFRGHFSPEEHRGVEVPGIYWHFVDVMWSRLQHGLRPLACSTRCAPRRRPSACSFVVAVVVAIVVLVLLARAIL